MQAILLAKSKLKVDLCHDFAVVKSAFFLSRLCCGLDNGATRQLHFKQPFFPHGKIRITTTIMV